MARADFDDSGWADVAWFSLRRHEALPAFDFLGRSYSRDGTPVAAN